MQKHRDAYTQKKTQYTAPNALVTSINNRLYLYSDTRLTFCRCSGSYLGKSKARSTIAQRRTENPSSKSGDKREARVIKRANFLPKQSLVYFFLFRQRMARNSGRTAAEPRKLAGIPRNGYSFLIAEIFLQTFG